MDKPLISFILPAYNVECYIDDCLKHLMAESEIDFEVIVVDDGSTDRTGAIADEWAGKDSRITVFHTSNQGQGDARNKGMEAARGEYLFFNDPDDYVLWDGIKQLLSKAECKDAEIVNGSYTRLVNGALEQSPEGLPEGSFCRVGTEQEQRLFHRLKTENLFGYSTNKLYKRSLVEKSGVVFGHMREITMEDQLFNCMLYVDDPRACYFDIPVFVYRIREESTSKRADPLLSKKLSNMLQLYAEYLHKRGADQQNQDIMVPLAMRCYAWAGFSALRLEDHSVAAIAQQLRFFLERPFMAELLGDRGRRRSIDTISSFPQRVAFKFFYDTARWGNGSFNAFVIKLGAPVIRKYVGAVVK